MPGSDNIYNTNDVLANLALSTAEDTYTFTAPTTDPLRTTGKTRADVVLQSDSSWFYSHKTSGPYFLVGPFQPLRLDGIATGQKIFVKAQAGTPTLYLMVAK